MYKEEYNEVLKDVRWKRFRVKVLKRDKYKCVKCGKNKCELHIHHKLYIIGRKPWEYQIEHLETLCASCHKNLHKEFSIPFYKSYDLIDKNGGAPEEDNNLKHEIESDVLKEKIVKEICALYYSMLKAKEKDKKLKILYQIRKHQRSYLKKYGNDLSCFPIEIVNKLFLEWDG